MLIPTVLRLLVVSVLALSTGDRPSGSGPVDEPRSKACGAARFNVRSMDPRISELLDEGCARSSTFRTLVETIEDAGGIVYVALGRCPVRGMRACLMHVLHDGGGARYLWIALTTIDSPAELIPLIGHELQHAAEVLHEPSIRTSMDILSFYRSVDAAAELGVKTSMEGRAYETDAAISIAEAVRADLATTALERAPADIP